MLGDLLVGELVVLVVKRLATETHLKPALLDVVGTLTVTWGSVALVYGFVSAAENG